MRGINELIEVVKGSSARRYTVEGEIVFKFRPSREAVEYCLAPLRDWVALTHTSFPWKDKNDHDGEEVSTFRYLGEGHVVVHNINPQEQHVWFKIVPTYDCLRQNQLHAYEKHLAKLAEELDKKKLFGAVSVRSILRITSVTSYGD